MGQAPRLKLPPLSRLYKIRYRGSGFSACRWLFLFLKVPGRDDYKVLLIEQLYDHCID